MARGDGRRHVAEGGGWRQRRAVGVVVEAGDGGGALAERLRDEVPNEEELLGRGRDLELAAEGVVQVCADARGRRQRTDEDLGAEVACDE